MPLVCIYVRFINLLFCSFCCFLLIFILLRLSFVHYLFLSLFVSIVSII
nr:MAG TPA: hypothetical protein [Bacteriophage sp.]